MIYPTPESNDSHSTTDLLHKYELIEDEIAGFLETEEKEEIKAYM